MVRSGAGVADRVGARGRRAERVAMIEFGGRGAGPASGRQRVDRIERGPEDPCVAEALGQPQDRAPA